MGIPFIDINLTKDNIDDVIKAVIPVVEPEWNLSTVTSEILPKGLLNMIVLCRPTVDHQGNNDVIIIKNVDEFFAGPFKGVQHAIQFIDGQGFGPGVLCFFKNGLAMKHTIGNPLDWNHPDLFNENVWQPIAEEMAKWHSRSMLKKAKENGVRELNILWGYLLENYKVVTAHKGMDYMRHLYPTFKELTEAERRLREHMLENDELEIAMTHGDLNGSNIAPYQKQNSDQNGIQVIDYDFTGICYSQIDIAWYMGSFLNLAEMRFDQLPDKEYELKFCQHYLKCRKQLDGLDKSVEQLYRELQKAKLFICLRYVLSGPSFLYLHDGTAFLQFSADRWREFQEKRDIVCRTGEFRTGVNYFNVK